MNDNFDKLQRQITLIFLIALFVINTAIGFFNLAYDNPLTVILPFIFALSTIPFFFYMRKNLRRVGMIIVISFSVIVIPLFWYLDFGTQGGFQYYIAVYYVSIFILSADSRKKAIFLSLFTWVINMGMIYVEYLYPELFANNNERSLQFVDTAFSMTLVNLGITIILLKVLDRYTQERNANLKAQEALAKSMNELEILNQKLSDLALTDQLTGLHNRHSLENHLKELHSRFQRHGHCYCVMVMDIDFFKKVNDTYGHDGGDLILKGVGSILKNNVRDIDFPARFGGEEFILIMQDCDIASAGKGAERIRKLIQDSDFDGIKVTISYGLARPVDIEPDYSKALKRADEALYFSKENGRNRGSLNTVGKITEIR